MTGLAPCKKLVAQLVRIRLRCRRPEFNPWVGKTLWKRKRLPTPVFWPGEFHRLYSPWGRKESDTTERLSLSLSVKKQKRPERSRSLSLPGHDTVGSADTGKRALTKADHAGPREVRKRIRVI